MTSSPEVPVRVSALEVPVRVHATAVVVVNDQTLSVANGFPARSLTPSAPPLIVAV